MIGMDSGAPDVAMFRNGAGVPLRRLYDNALRPVSHSYAAAARFSAHQGIGAAPTLSGASSGAAEGHRRAIHRRCDVNEPPSPEFRSNHPRFLVGKNSRGHWVVQDKQHLYGGLFVNRTAALRFAMFESGNRPQAVIMVPGVIELDLAGAAEKLAGPVAAAAIHYGRRAA
jgi:hypothetical protein